MQGTITSARAATPRAGKFDAAAPVKVSFAGNRSAVRTFFRISGILLIMCAPGMWVLPGAGSDAETAVMKFGSSLFFLLCGIALLMRNHVAALPEVHFDPVRRELRVVQRNDRGRPSTVLRRSYDSLGGAHFTPQWVELWNQDGSHLMALPVSDPDMRRSLRAQLGRLCT